MGHKVPGWLVLALVVTAWCAGRLVDAAGGPLGVVALVSATLSLGGFIAAARIWPSPRVDASDHEEGFADRIAGLVVCVVWFVASLAVYAFTETLFPWADPPGIEALRGNELLAGASALAVGALSSQFGHGHARSQARQCAAAPAPGGG